RLIRRSGSAATNPVIYLRDLELPEAADLVGCHALFSDPGIDGVFCHAKVDGDVVGRQPRLSHAWSSLISTYGPSLPMISKFVSAGRKVAQLRRAKSSPKSCAAYYT